MHRTALLLFVLAAPLGAQKTFEGAVSLNVTGENGKTVAMNYLLKDGKMRLEQGADGRQMGIIMDGPGKKMLIIMTAQRMYIEREMLTPAEMKATGEGMKRPAITKTGRTEIIAGYKCEHLTITGDDGTTDACVTSELGASFMSFGGNPMAPPKPETSWSSSLERASFPLKAQKGDRVIMEVTKIERKSLDAALFAAPEGFQKMGMPGSMPGMPGRKPPLR